MKTKDRRYLTRDELVETLRIGKHAETKFRLDPEDPLPHIRIGRRILYDIDEVHNWAKRRARRATRRRA